MTNRQPMKPHVDRGGNVRQLHLTTTHPVSINNPHIRWAGLRATRPNPLQIIDLRLRRLLVENIVLRFFLVLVFRRPCLRCLARSLAGKCLCIVSARRCSSKCLGAPPRLCREVRPKRFRNEFDSSVDARVKPAFRTDRTIDARVKSNVHPASNPINLTQMDGPLNTLRVVRVNTGPFNALRDRPSQQFGT